jgi:hypothetical protein
MRTDIGIEQALRGSQNLEGLWMVPSLQTSLDSLGDHRQRPLALEFFHSFQQCLLNRCMTQSRILRIHT